MPLRLWRPVARKEAEQKNPLDHSRRNANSTGNVARRLHRDVFGVLGNLPRLEAWRESGLAERKQRQSRRFSGFHHLCGVGSHRRLFTAKYQRRRGGYHGTSAW